MTIADDISSIIHEASASTREHAAKMVNAMIVIYEEHGLDAVPLSTMRELADAIATLPIYRRAAKP